MSSTVRPHAELYGSARAPRCAQTNLTEFPPCNFISRRALSLHFPALFWPSSTTLPAAPTWCCWQRLSCGRVLLVESKGRISNPTLSVDDVQLMDVMRRQRAGSEPIWLLPQNRRLIDLRRVSTIYGHSLKLRRSIQTWMHHASQHVNPHTFAPVDQPTCLCPGPPIS